MIDSHCHLDHEPLYKNISEVIIKSKKAGINKLLTICTTIKSFENILKLIVSDPIIYGTFGIHPHESEKDTITIEEIVNNTKKHNKIIGIGETKKQREELIFEIASFQPEEVTINLLVPIPGTPLEIQKPVKIEEIIRVFATLRFLLPKSIIKISGGREVNLVDDGQKLLLSGANGIISSGYLTMNGNSPEKDIKMLKKINLEV